MRNYSFINDKIHNHFAVQVSSHYSLNEVKSHLSMNKFKYIFIVIQLGLIFALAR